VRRSNDRRGLAIPLAAGFAVIMTILIVVTTMARSSTKRQTKATFQAIKAHFVAQGAIQAALYKFRILPNEGFDAAKEGNQAALEKFVSDVGYDSIPLSVSPPGDTWMATIDGERSKALNAVSEGYDDWTHVVTLTSIGRVQDGYLDGKGQVEERVEELTKTVEVRKQR
jgi:hypothetical protein